MKIKKAFGTLYILVSFLLPNISMASDKDKTLAFLQKHNKVTKSILGFFDKEDPRFLKPEFLNRFYSAYVAKHGEKNLPDFLLRYATPSKPFVSQKPWGYETDEGEFFYSKKVDHRYPDSSVYIEDFPEVFSVVDEEGVEKYSYGDFEPLFGNAHSFNSALEVDRDDPSPLIDVLLG